MTRAPSGSLSTSVTICAGVCAVIGLPQFGHRASPTQEHRNLLRLRDKALEHYPDWYEVELRYIRADLAR